MERALLAFCALLLNMAIAGPRRWYDFMRIPLLAQFPVKWIREADRKCSQYSHTQQQREFRGDMLMVAVIVVSLIASGLCGWLFRYNLRFGEILVLVFLFPVRPTWDCVWPLYKSLKIGDLPGAYRALEGTVWQHHRSLDEFGLARAGVEILAVHFSEKILAPLLWYLAFGLPGLFASKATYLIVETLWKPYHSKPGFGEGFLRGPQTVHYVMHYISARIAALFWLVALLFLPSGQPMAAAKQITASDIDVASPHTVSLLAAAASLRLSLGGPVSAYTGQDWIGGGTTKAVAAHVGKALYLFGVFHLFLLILLGLLL